jgi:hypothetical protein
MRERGHQKRIPYGSLGGANKAVQARGRSMLDRYFERKQQRLTDEEKPAKQTAEPKTILAHSQAAMLDRIEHSAIRKRRAANVSETLANIG